MTDSDSIVADNRVDPDFDVVGLGMKQWRHERPDLDCSGKAVVGRILRLQEIIMRAFNIGLEPHGLRYHAFAVLATLRVSGPPFRMSPTRLRETLLMTSGGTSNLLARLERQGWVVRHDGPHDGRTVIVELTEAGKVLADQAMESHAKVERELIRMFSEAERDSLSAMLSRMLVLNQGWSNGMFHGAGTETASNEKDKSNEQVE